MDSIKKTYFSYSQINTFLNCPQKYKLLYVNKIKLKSEGIEAFIGKIVHEVLEWIYKNKVSYLLWDNIQEKYFKIWNKKWHNNIFYFKRNMLFEKNKYKYKNFNQEYFKKIGLEYLRNYYRVNNGPNLDYNYTIGVESKLFAIIDGAKFKVVIDRLDKKDDVISIHDYKTGKTKTEKSLKNDLQLTIYQLAVNQKFSNKVVTLNWHFLKENNKDKQRVSFQKNKDEISKDIDKISKVVNDIKKNVAKGTDELNFPAKVSFLCNWCYLWKHCYAKKEYNEKNSAINVK